jgi:hypothetical protein
LSPDTHHGKSVPDPDQPLALLETDIFKAAIAGGAAVVAGQPLSAARVLRGPFAVMP